MKKWAVKFICSTRSLVVRLATEAEVANPSSLHSMRVRGYLVEAMTPQDAKAAWMEQHPDMKVRK